MRLHLAFSGSGAYNKITVIDFSPSAFYYIDISLRGS